MPYVNSANPGSGQNQPFDVTGYVTDIEVDDAWGGGAVKPGTLMQLTYLGFTPDPEVTGDGAYNYPTVIPWVQQGASNVLGVCVGGPTLGADTYPTDGSSVVNAGAMVLTEGFCQVLCDNTTVVGDYLIPSATTQGAASDGGTTPTVPTIGTVLEAVTISSGTALVWAYVRLAGAGGGGGGGAFTSAVITGAGAYTWSPGSPNALLMAGSATSLVVDDATTDQTPLFVFNALSIVLPVTISVIGGNINNGNGINPGESFSFAWSSAASSWVLTGSFYSGLGYAQVTSSTPFAPVSGIPNFLACSNPGSTVDITASPTPIGGEIITVANVDSTGTTVVTFDPTSTTVAYPDVASWTYDTGTSAYVPVVIPLTSNPTFTDVTVTGEIIVPIPNSDNRAAQAMAVPLSWGTPSSTTFSGSVSGTAVLSVALNGTTNGAGFLVFTLILTNWADAGQTMECPTYFYTLAAAARSVTGAVTGQSVTIGNPSSVTLPTIVSAVNDVLIIEGV